MKYLLIFFLLFTFVALGLGRNKSFTNKHNNTDLDTARTKVTTENTDSINIKQIVEQQINSIKQKQLRKPRKQIILNNIKNETSISSTKKELKNLWSVFIQKSVKPLFDKIQSTFLKSGSISVQVSILSIASFISTLVLIIRRKIINRKYFGKDSFKDNIRLLREERVVNKVDEKFKGIRSGLVNKSISYKNTKTGISDVAKEMRIAKGEVMLAAKIKSYELNNSWLGGIYNNMNWKIF